MSAVVVWLGSAAPARSVRWLDGALAAAAQLGDATALAAGGGDWLELAADRAARAGLTSAGLPLELRLDYLGWAQVVAAAARQLAATTVLVDEASRPERAAEVGAIGELLAVPHVTAIVALARDADHLRASRLAGRELASLRVRGPAVLGVRLAGKPIAEYPTPVPAGAMRRLDLAALHLDAAALAQRALPARATVPARQTAERIAEYLAGYLAAPEVM